MTARYRGAIWREDDLSVFDFEGGNLNEFSRLGNPSLAALEQMLEEEPGEVAFVGDNTDEDPAFLCIPYIEYLFWILWTSRAAGQKLPTSVPAGRNINLRYIVNTDKREYVNMTAYEQRCQEMAQGDPERYALCHHPLPLLASVGYGDDYGKIYCGPAAYQCGRWYLDTIAVTDEAPEGMQELAYVFVESGDAVAE